MFLFNLILFSSLSKGKIGNRFFDVASNVPLEQVHGKSCLKTFIYSMSPFFTLLL